MRALRNPVPRGMVIETKVDGSTFEDVIVITAG
jgi:hypothetical protein